MEKENDYNLKSIAQDLLYYGYNFRYFYDNYAEFLPKEKALELWEKERERLGNCF